jgi:hypothetical protein
VFAFGRVPRALFALGLPPAAHVTAFFRPETTAIVVISRCPPRPTENAAQHARLVDDGTYKSQHDLTGRLHAFAFMLTTEILAQ